MANKNHMHTSKVARARNLMCVDDVMLWNDMVFVRWLESQPYPKKKVKIGCDVAIVKIAQIQNYQYVCFRGRWQVLWLAGFAVGCSIFRKRLAVLVEGLEDSEAENSQASEATPNKGIAFKVLKCKIEIKEVFDVQRNNCNGKSGVSEW